MPIIPSYTEPKQDNRESLLNAPVVVFRKRTKQGTLMHLLDARLACDIKRGLVDFYLESLTIHLLLLMLQMFHHKRINN